MKRTKRNIAHLGLLTALAMILSYIETFIPPIFTAIPGIKMGLPNIVILYVLYRFGVKWAFGVSITRVILVSMLFGNAVTLLYSLVGALLSIATMYILKRFGNFSHVGVSVAGGVSHNLGQILVAMLILETVEIGYYMVVLALSGTISGILVGLCGANLIKRTVEMPK